MKAHRLVPPLAPGRAEFAHPLEGLRCHLSTEIPLNGETVRKAKAVHALIEVYLEAGLPRAAAVEAAWRDCSQCFSSLFLS